MTVGVEDALNPIRVGCGLPELGLLRKELILYLDKWCIFIMVVDLNIHV
jgi:hypothetical protein